MSAAAMLVSRGDKDAREIGGYTDVSCPLSRKKIRRYNTVSASFSSPIAEANSTPLLTHSASFHSNVDSLCGQFPCVHQGLISSLLETASNDVTKAFRLIQQISDSTRLSDFCNSEPSDSTHRPPAKRWERRWDHETMEDSAHPLDHESLSITPVRHCSFSGKNVCGVFGVQPSGVDRENALITESQSHQLKTTSRLLSPSHTSGKLGDSASRHAFVSTNGLPQDSSATEPSYSSFLSDSPNTCGFAPPDSEASLPHEPHGCSAQGFGNPSRGYLGCASANTLTGLDGGAMAMSLQFSNQQNSKAEPDSAFASSASRSKAESEKGASLSPSSLSFRGSTLPFTSFLPNSSGGSARETTEMSVEKPHDSASRAGYPPSTSSCMPTASNTVAHEQQNDDASTRAINVQGLRNNLRLLSRVVLTQYDKIIHLQAANAQLEQEASEAKASLARSTEELRQCRETNQALQYYLSASNNVSHSSCDFYGNGSGGNNFNFPFHRGPDVF